LAAAVEEQIEVMKRHGDKIDYDALAEMVLLHRCIKETLRLHPPLTMLLRQSHRDFTVTTMEGQEFDVPKGHMCWNQSSGEELRRRRGTGRW
jgi:sterol 14-demethylase